MSAYTTYVHITEKCLNYNKLYAMHQSFILSMTIYLANWIEPDCPR